MFLALKKVAKIMKDGVHPEYYETQVSCGCGNKFTTRSTRKELKVDICNVCHPVLHGQAEVRRHGRADREVQEQVRRRRLRQPQARQEVAWASPAILCTSRRICLPVPMHHAA